MIPKIPRAPINNKKMEDASNEHLPFLLLFFSQTATHNCCDGDHIERHAKNEDYQFATLSAIHCQPPHLRREHRE